MKASPRGAQWWDRVVLVGFMGAGKSAVGRDLARRMGWSFHDVDSVVERETGRSIPEIFTVSGEATFRALEAEVVARLLAHDGVVVATGGGWVAAEARLERVPPRTATVWLRVSPETAIRRAESEAGMRPLLDTDDPVETARTLLAARVPFYTLARWAVDTERFTVEDVTARILDLLSAPPPESKD